MQEHYLVESAVQACFLEGTRLESAVQLVLALQENYRQVESPVQVCLLEG